MPGEWGIEITGLKPVYEMFLRLKEFDTFMKPVVQAAVDAGKPHVEGALPPGKVRASVGTKVKRYRAGLIGKVGPQGGAHRAGYLGALFLEIGTGTGKGSRHRAPHRIMPKNSKALAFASQSQVNARFGAQASIFTKGGRYAAVARRRFGNAGLVVVRSTRGMDARPWLQNAKRASEGPMRQAAAEALHRAIHG